MREASRGFVHWIFLVALFQIVLFVAVGLGDVWNQNDQEDFLAGESYNVDTITIPGKVILATEWMKHSLNPILEGSPGSWDEYGIETPSIIKDNGSYKMWYSGYSGSLVWKVGYAESQDGVTWTKSESNPVLSPGPPGSWDDEAVIHPRVLKDGSICKMWYTGRNSTGYMIGYAESDDGISWTKSSQNPVLGEEDGWDSYSVVRSHVIRDGPTYKMWYGGGYSPPFGQGIGYATSTDGLNWTKYGEGPIFASEGENWTYYIIFPTILKEGSVYRMWYSGCKPDENGRSRCAIGYATSINGINWTRDPSNPVLVPGPTGSWDNWGVLGPSVLNESGNLEIWYSGNQRFLYPRKMGYASALYVEEGVFVSSVLDTGNSTTQYGNISWSPASQSSGTELKFQIASNNDNLTWSFVGPDGSPDTFYATGQPIWSGHNDDRYLRYKAILSTTRPEKTPVLDDVSISYYPPLPPPSPPTNLNAILSGRNLENVTLAWMLSPDDGQGMGNVIRYDIYRNETYDSRGSDYRSYDSVPNGTWGYTDLNAGEGDSSNHFYLVCAVDALDRASCPLDQAGKFTRPLPKGPNLISIPLIQSNESIESVLQTVEYDKMWTYDSFGRDWKWHMTFKNYRRGLWNVNHTMGSWVNVTRECNLTVAGLVPENTSIHLSAGWNLVGFPSFDPAYAVSNLNATVGSTRVEGFDFLPPYYLRVLGMSDVLQAGHAYWVKVETDTIWTIEID